MIYFVQAGDDGPVKIGFAKDPAKRMAALGTASPERLRLLCVIDGDPRHEQDLHEHFAAERIRGEWFDPSGRLVSFIDNCRDVMALGYEDGRDPALWLLMQTRSKRRLPVERRRKISERKRV